MSSSTTTTKAAGPAGPKKYGTGEGGLWVIDKTGAIGTSEASSATYLKRELGFYTEANRNGAALAILADPSTQINNYNDSLNTIYNAAGNVFNDDYNKLLNLGLPDEKARKIATAKASRFVEDEKLILDFAWPLASDMNIMATAAAKAGTPININQGGAKLSAKGRKKRQ